jgi:nitrous oxide reductase accessory protein NosL
MTQNAKLFASIRRNPADVRFRDACKAAVMIGFVRKGGKGSHRAFARPGEPIALNFQDRGGKIPPYQARQLIQMLNKYVSESEDSDSRNASRG